MPDALRRYVMIGDPVTTVRTPRLLEERLAADGVRAVVETRRVAPADLHAFLRGVRDDTGVDGFMVTMPHKRAIIPYLEAVSRTAALVGSVNAVKRLPSGGLAGAQFDGVALVRALLAAGAPLIESRVLLLGFGGAGVAIAQALMAHGCVALEVGDPYLDASAMTGTVDRLRQGTPDASATAVWSGEGGFDVLVNATPLGMRPEDPSPFTADQAAAASWVADIVADPPATRLAARAREAGAVLVTGRDVVRAQIDPIAAWLETAAVEQ